MTDPTKSPVEVVYGALAAAVGVLAWWAGRRKAKYEQLNYEPVPRLEFEDHKKNMDAKLKEIAIKQLADSSAILSSLQDLRLDIASLKALNQAGDERLDRIEDRINRVFDRKGRGD
jgi:hypothetical protein